MNLRAGCCVSIPLWLWWCEELFGHEVQSEPGKKPVKLWMSKRRRKTSAVAHSPPDIHPCCPPLSLQHPAAAPARAVVRPDPTPLLLCAHNGS
jgi:hypothetical protein